MVGLQLLGWYPNWLSWIFTIILNISVSLALYSLVVFYHVFAKELAPHNPLAKFMCIKGIVFFCFWQVNSPLHPPPKVARPVSLSSSNVYWFSYFPLPSPSLLTAGTSARNSCIFWHSEIKPFLAWRGTSSRSSSECSSDHWNGFLLPLSAVCI